MIEIASPMTFAKEIEKLYEQGLPPGWSTGWPDIDAYYTVAPGFWTVVTGVPASGKSTWMDCLMLNLIEQGWKFITYSPENQPTALHVAYLIQKYLKRPFRANYNNRLEPRDVQLGIEALNDSIRLLRVAADSNAFPGMRGLLFAATEAMQEWEGHNIGFIIDPWNEMDHAPVQGMNETQMTSHELMMFRHWVRERNCHAWIVAHPQKPARDKNGKERAITLYDINGSAAYFNKCDHGIVITRLGDDRTEVEVQKCRFAHLGHKGSAILQYNSGTGTYDDEWNAANRYGFNDDHTDF